VSTLAVRDADVARRRERLRVRLCYLWRHRRLPDLDRPTRFTELVQLRKLDDRDPLMPALADKLAVKAHVADLLGSGWVTPTLWSGTELPAEAPWPRPFVLKSRHGCRQVRVIRPGDCWAAVRAQAERWTRRPYGVWLDEWLYRHIPRGFLVEPFAGPGPALPVDYKFFVFGGRVRYAFVHLGRALHRRAHAQVVVNRGWRAIAATAGAPEPPRPATLDRMIAGAEALGRPFDFVRVDLYALPDGPRFGEMTFYPGSGLDHVPFDLDRAMGAHWLAARPDLDFRGIRGQVRDHRGVMQRDRA
jgi:hypothetical protein